jgi:hypothetical protein
VKQHDLNRLLNILSLKRPANSAGELKLIQRHLVKIPNIIRDDFGNWYVRIGTAPVLWSCHTDTVHVLKHDRDIYQQLSVDAHGFITVKNSSCLGADNGVGVWLLLNMIEAGVEGLYVFHRQEECGGGGSRFIATATPELLSGIKFAIAFDRKKTRSIITHQITRCCSREFAESLATALGMDHELDDGGTFTDTANYTHLIPECTNVSAGFYNEHTYHETLDSQYAMDLLAALLKLDLGKLTVARNVDDPVDYGSWAGDWFEQMGRKHGSRYSVDFEPDFDEDMARGYALHLIERNPEKVYEVLKLWGIADEFISDLEQNVS